MIEFSDAHVVAATDYCRAIVAGEIAASKLTIGACKRQLADLERFASDETYPFRFDEALASRPCRFLESLPHVKGPKANASLLIELEAWQCFIVTTLYGWVRKDTGKRRFRRAYCEVARGNAKTTLLAGLGLYALSSDGEEGAEVAAGATTREQARLVFGTGQAMLRKRPELKAKLGLRDTNHAIVKMRNSSRFFPLSREADNQDGLNLHLGIVDELHAHRTRDIYDVLETAIAKRDQSMLVVITTAGSDTSGICYELRMYCKKVLEGIIEDDAQFAIIYTIDEDAGDIWSDPAVWPKANPNWGISVMPDVVAGLAHKAMQVASAQNNFKTKHLNVWCSADVSWMNMTAWDACADTSLDIADFAGQDVWIGIDLASRSDLACRAKLFFRDVETSGKSVQHWYLFVDSYLPEETVESSSNASYIGWAREGWIKTTPGQVLDFAILHDDMILDRDTFRIREAPFDPYQATQFATELLAEGVPMIEYRNTVLTMSPPMKELEALVLERRLHHNGNPCLRWQMSNVVAHTDQKANIFPRRERAENKIDAVVATIMSLGRALAAGDDVSPYETRGLLAVGGTPKVGRVERRWEFDDDD